MFTKSGRFQVEIPSTVYKTVVYGFFVSLVANPLIYTYINKHFKEFLEDEIRSSIKSISSIVLGSVHGGRRGTKVEVHSDSLVEVSKMNRIRKCWSLIG